MPCEHLSKFKEEFGLEPYRTVHAFFVANSGKEQAFHLAWLSCFSCGLEVGRLLSCMHCIYFGCQKVHAEFHSKEHSHNIFMELSNGHLLCYQCKDYVYDEEFEGIAVQNSLSLNKTGQDPTHYVPWKPSVTEKKILEQHTRRIKLYHNSGFRGILNFGSNCFMNCIMQVLFHTPMLRDYFFTDKHECITPHKIDCFVCHFSRLFQCYYADDTSFLSLHETMYIVWQNASHLAGDVEHDAHEFFVAILDLLHQYLVPAISTKDPCHCIIDLIFHGKMQSDVVCLACGTVSTTIDPIWGFSLDIPDLAGGGSLYECLIHYTRAEALGSKEKIGCVTCESNQESTKQLTFKVLPIVMVIQLKRFEHGEKKKRLVPFPFELDMAPFMSGYRNSCDGDKVTVKAQDPLSDYRYSLYAVVVHIGKAVCTGHYVAFIRSTKNTWFRCNDITIQPATVEEVMGCEAYILFYHKIILTYQ